MLVKYWHKKKAVHYKKKGMNTNKSIISYQVKLLLNFYLVQILPLLCCHHPKEFEGVHLIIFWFTLSFNIHDVSKPKLSIQIKHLPMSQLLLSTFWMDHNMKCGDWMICSTSELLDIKTCLEQQLSAITKATVKYRWLEQTIVNYSSEIF